MHDFEPIEEDDQTVTYGGYIAPLPADHWSLQLEYLKLKAEIKAEREAQETQETESSPIVIEPSWYGLAANLASRAEENA
jgi:hypothetical protein